MRVEENLAERGLFEVGCLEFCRWWHSSLAAIGSAIELGNFKGLCFYSDILGDMGCYGRARYILERGLELEGRNPQLRYQLGMEQLKVGEYALGWKNFESRLWLREQYRYMVSGPIPWWGGESLCGKNLLLMPELGFGDD